MNIELFPCSGGMAEGFRRAGVRFDVAFDKDPDACDSYEHNHGHRPIQIDVNDLGRLVAAGWTSTPIELLVADPPCTPWSRAGKRAGTDDPRDCLRITAELIRVLRPRAYLIGNVPGLQDSTSWHVVQEVIGGLAAHGYCVVDYASLDAADYGVPQHRIRPFWFGHLHGPCIQWPAPTHGAPSEQLAIGRDGLTPWVTCRQALAHLPLEQLGRPVRLRRAGTDGHPAAMVDGVAPTIPGGGAPGHSAPQVVLANAKHLPSGPDSPAKTIAAKVRGNGGQVLATHPRHPVSNADSPSRAIKTNGGRAAQGGAVLSMEEAPVRAKRPPSSKGPQRLRAAAVDAPSPTVLSDTDHVGHSSPKLEWPWDRPATTVCSRDTIPPPGHHPETGSILSMPNAIILSERAAAILQGFPEGWVFAGATKRARWAQLGQAMPPPLAEAVARAVVAQMRATRREAA
jgi:site-specific DNA-cytosine methylase